jgi:hypothetical protein
MKGFLRRLRGILGTGLTWAVGWPIVNLAFGLLVGLPPRFLGPIAISSLFSGFLAGGTFAVILSIVERRHTLEDLSLKRTAVWGGIGGTLLRAAVLPFVLPLGLPVSSLLLPFVVDGLTGAGFASGSVALAKRADRKLIEGDEPLPALEGE